MLKDKQQYNTVRFTPKTLITFYQKLVDKGTISKNGAGAQRLAYFKSLTL
jgi:hypothetical protein